MKQQIPATLAALPVLAETRDATIWTTRAVHSRSPGARSLKLATTAA